MSNMPYPPKYIYFSEVDNGDFVVYSPEYCTLQTSSSRPPPHPPLGWGGGNKNGEQDIFWKRDMSQNSRSVFFFARNPALAGTLALAGSLGGERGRGGVIIQYCRPRV